MKNLFAIEKKTQKIVYISKNDNLPNGEACGCICPLCGEPMIAKHGGKYEPGKSVKQAHFAHKAQTNCDPDKANESALHLLAKEILKDSTYINLPEYTMPGRMNPDYNIEDEEQCKPFTVLGKGKLSYQADEIKEEVRFENFKPDIVISKKNGQLAIEIAVTHFVDDEKKRKFREANLSVIEIDLSAYWKALNDRESTNEEIFSEENFRRSIIDQTICKKWIYNRREPVYIKKLQEKHKKDEETFQKRNAEKQGRIEYIRNTKKRIESNCNRLTSDAMAYHERLANLRDDNRAINELKKHKELYSKCMKEHAEIPIFLDIPVTGEFVFECDRRVWQIMVFDYFVFSRKDGITPKLSAPYYKFYNSQRQLLNFDYLFPKEQKHRYLSNGRDYLILAIVQYIWHLTQLGFIDAKPHDINEFNLFGSFPIQRRNNITPTNSKYWELLRNHIGELSEETDPAFAVERLKEKYPQCFRKAY